MSKKLYLFTYKFPFGHTSEGPFLLQELEYLSKVFNEIIIVPYSADINEPILTKKYSIDLSLRNYRSSNFLEPYKPLLKKRIILELISRLLKLQTNIARQEWQSIKAASDIASWTVRNNEDKYNSVFYTYFFTDITIGLAFAKDKGLKGPIVTRAHGGDLYTERKKFRHFSFREYVLSRLAHVFLISNNGYDYMVEKYPNFRDKFSVSKLGVLCQDHTTGYSDQERNISIISCSYIRPEKRVDLLCRGLIDFCNANENWKITWNHFGGGDLQLIEVINRMVENVPTNLKVVLWGNVPNSTIINFYKNNKIDFFISVSESEGIPVSIMEAISFGVPVIATNVGGINEIVTSENGILLPKGVSSLQIAESIMIFITEKQHINKRKASKQIWKENYDADANFSDFSIKMKNLCDEYND